jgi:hypothetical protein
MTEQRPSDLAGLIRLGIREALFEVRTAVPARVEKWMPDEQTIDAVPLIQRVRVIDGERLVDEYPVITRLPVSFLRWGGFVFRCPLEQGNIVTLLVSDRELERWLASDGDATVEPRGRRMHSLNDAIVLPGIAPWSDPISDLDDGDMVLGREDGSGEVRVRADGTIALGGRDAERRGVARLNDETTSDNSTDAQFWAWVTAVDAFIKAAGAGVFGTAGTVLAGALSVYQASSPAAPSSQTGQITSASDETETE